MPRRLTEIEEELVLTTYWEAVNNNQSYTLRAIAYKLNLSDTFVKKVLTKHNLKPEVKDPRSSIWTSRMFGKRKE